MTRFAKLVVAQGLKEVSQERRDRLVALIGSQDRTLMWFAWKESMAFDSRRRLTEIRCPTLVVAGSNDQAVPIHHAKTLHDGITGSRLVVVDGADHALLWTRTADLLRATDEFLDA
jgi:pimeloyl-ACP methyl ester carboxylesterase